MRVWKSSIFWRIYLINLALICILLASMFVTSAVTLPEISREKAQTITDASVNRITEQVENVADYIHVVIKAVQQDSNFHSTDGSVLRKGLQDIVETSAIIDSAVITDPNGVVRQVIPNDLADLQDVDLGYREYIRHSLVQKTPYISDVLWGAAGRPVVVVSVPILDELGVVERSVNLTLRISENKFLSTLFQKIELGGEGYVYIFDRNGRLISHPDKTRIGENISQNEVVQSVTNNKTSGYRQVVNTRGVLMDASYAYVPEIGWGVVAQVPDESVYEGFNAFRHNLWILCILIFIPLSVVTAIYARQIIKPIRQLYNAVDQVARGNYEMDIETVSSSREIGLLTKRFNDMLHTIRDAREQIQYQAYHDPLTGLPNRMLAADRLGQMLAHAQRTRTQVAVLFLNLDRFKGINDSLGHSIGDRLLREVAERISGCVSESDTVSRIGGDEFLLMIPDVMHVQDVLNVVQEILQLLNIPFYLDSHELFLTASIGISFYPDDGDEITELIKNADIAMHRAKQQGRNTWQLHTTAMNQHAAERLLMENHLRKALERREFLVYYQPKIDLMTGDLVGMEALVRWNHSIWGLVSPAKFIPVAEDSGLIQPIGEWVLRTACDQTKRWQDAGLPPMRIAVNLSAHQVEQANLVETVQSILQETGLEPRYLELELTESILMQNTETVNMTLRRLRDMGISIAIDDFGTGYSSLSYLHRFPITCLKIDQSFVRRIEGNGDRTDGVIAKAVIALAHNLDLEVVAEGVEEKSQMQFLRDEGCSLAQGFLFSKPVPREEFEILLTKAGTTSYTESI
ncbi:bifunctional diguanylate cyclase/phosphodiesterase [Tumebacillus permanentifrigoris]|uniref:Diguanylate cyclase (GGDEF)-like protein n=1 Tax=Tumebacillus permanentifrigoris TaxID=378543 RepID=A0A316DDT8_9BACL|nr:EAL domain-containing protein [Tumebacillus permanentifrigoris]PWK16397.1 diguanylate cyclase (GGDEF)-like protein [Tumebacillus permanentifrigoris]